MQIQFPLCDAHRRRRVGGILLSLLGVPAFLLFAIVSAVNGNGIVVFISILLIFASLIAGAVISSVTSTRKMDDNYVWLKVETPFRLSCPLMPDGRLS